MQCEYCGRALKPGEWQCPGCGAPVEQHKEVKREQARPNTEKTAKVEPQKAKENKSRNTHSEHKENITGVWLHRADYAGFSRRLIAEWIDWMIIFIFLAIIEVDSLDLPIYCAYQIIALSYICKGATIGKKAMNIRVVNANYEMLTLGQSAIRLVCKAVSLISMCIGFIMIIFTSKKQSLHDRLCETYVIRVRK